MSEIVTRAANEEDRDALEALLQAIEAEQQPGLADAGQPARARLAASLLSFDFLSADSCWVVMAWLGGRPAGYALAVHLPKADARRGFLFVDELYVLRPFRRRGVARALLAHVQRLAAARRLAGVRLLVRPHNVAARALYRSLGYEEHETIFCQRLCDEPVTAKDGEEHALR